MDAYRTSPGRFRWSNIQKGLCRVEWDLVEESTAPLKKRGKEAKGERSLRLSLTHVELLVGQHLLLEGKLQRGGLNTKYLSGGHEAYI
jgi:hypothetical protein